MTGEQQRGSMEYLTPSGEWDTLELPLSQYSDAELLDISETLTNRLVGFGDPTNNAFAMGYVSLELNRRLFRRMEDIDDD